MSRAQGAPRATGATAPTPARASEGWPALVLGVALGVVVLAWDPAAGADHPKRVLALALATVTLAVLLPSERVAPPLHRALALTLLAGLGWSGARLLVGSTAGLGRVELWVAGAGLAFALARLGATAALAAARTASLTVALALVITVAVSLALGARGMALHGGQGNPNWLGLALAPAALGTCGLTRQAAWSGLPSRRARTVGPRVALALVVLAPLAQAATEARTALASTLLALLAWVLARRGNTATPVSSPRGHGAGRKVALALGATLCLGAALVGVRAAPGGALAEALTGRLYLWRVSAAAAVDAWPWGVGTGGFVEAFTRAQGTALATLSPEAAALRHSTATTAHQDWLEIAIELGLPGLALGVALGWLTLRALRRRDVVDGVAALGALGLAALGDSPLTLPGPVLLAAPWIGVALASPDLAVPPAPGAAGRLPEPEASRVWALGLGLGLITTSAALAHAAPAWRADRLVTHARDALPAQGLAELDRAARLDPHSARASAELGLARLALGDVAGAEPALQRAAALQPALALTLGLGNAALLRGDRATARARYQQGIALHPGWFRGHAALALAAALDGDVDTARRHLEVARRLAPGDPRLPDIRERVERLVHREGTAGVAPRRAPPPAEEAPAGLPLPGDLR